MSVIFVPVSVSIVIKILCIHVRSDHRFEMKQFIHFCTFTSTFFSFLFFFLRPQLALVGLVAMAAAQKEEFLVIDDKVENNDIDADHLFEMENSDIVRRLVKSLQAYDR